MNSRIRRFRELLKREKLDGFIIAGPANLRYLCGYTGSNGLLLITSSNAVFYTDFRYAEQIRTEVRGARRRMLTRDLYAGFPAEDAKGVRRLGVEENILTLGRFRLLKKQLKKARVVPSGDLALELRRTKEPVEVAAIAAAQRITDRVFAKTLELIRPGVSEDDLALEIDFGFRAAGGETAFTSIVASGPNAAKPHAGHGPRKLRKGDVITFDIGCRYKGYCSDMTRTVFLGRVPARLRRVYGIVREAQEKALAVIKAGLDASVADAAARDHIAAAGFGKEFGHSLGHGVGLEVHERPVLAARSRDVLQPGDVVTVEPGIYLPGEGGVRIEDIVVVTKTGLRNLTRSPKEPVEL
jgi:Xaa-Pro aminopeptidase